MLGRVLAARLVRTAKLAERAGGVDLGAGAFRRNFHDAKDRARRRGIVPQGAQRSIGGAGIVDWHLASDPNLGDAGAWPAFERRYVGRVVIEKNGGAVGGVMPGDDPMNLLQHA